MTIADGRVTCDKMEANWRVGNTEATCRDQNETTFYFLRETEDNEVQVKTREQMSMTTREVNYC